MKSLIIISTYIFLNLFSAKVLAKDLFSMSIEELLNQNISSISSNTPTTEDNAPSVVKVITKEEIKEMGAITINEVLETIAGVHHDRAANHVSNKHISFRGIYSNLNQQVLILINGKRRKDNVQSSSFFYRRALFPVHNIKRIEIIKGPGSAIYGADALAGVINIITDGPNDDQGLEAGIISGSYKTNAGFVKYANNKNTLKYQASAYYMDSNINDEELDKDVQASWDSVFGTTATNTPTKMIGVLRDTVLETKMEYKNFQFEAMYSSAHGVNEYGTSGNIVDSPEPIIAIESRIRFTYADDLSSDTDIKVSITRDNFQQRVNGLFSLFPGGSNLGGGEFGPKGMIASPELAEDDDSIDLKVTTKKNKNHTTSFGTGLLHANLYEVKESKNFTGAGVPRGSTVDVTDTDEVYLPEISRTSYYLYAQDEWQFNNKLKLVYGGRWDNFSDFGSSTNPRASAIYNVNKSLTSKFIYGKAFRAPNFIELYAQNNPVVNGNKNLTAEKIEYYENANSYTVNDKLKLNLNLFKYQFTEVIDLENTIYNNIGKYYGEGFEVELMAQILKNLRLKANHSYAMVTDQNEQRAPKLAHNQSYLALNYQFYKKWSLSTQQYYISSIARASADPREDRDAYAYMNLSINSPQIKNGVQFSFQIKNVFDEDLKFTSNPNSFANASNQPSDSSSGRRAVYMTLRFKI